MRRRLALAAALALALVVDAAPAGAARARPLPVPAGYDGRVRELTPEERQRMTGTSWRPGCPVGLHELRAIEVPHVGFDGRVHRGTIVVHRRVAIDVNNAFAQMLGARFPIRKVAMVDDYGGSDDAAMAADATTGFNCRRVSGSRRWSMHAYGLAIDVNPDENPYVSRRVVSPPEGRAYVNRRDARPGMLLAGSAPVRAFSSIGWGWGGTWRSAKDWQHVSSNGR